MAHEEIRVLLGEELGRESPPPIGDLVEASIRQGRRMRRTRGLWAAGGGALALVGLMFSVFIVVNSAPARSQGLASAAVGPVTTTSSAAPAVSPGTTASPAVSPPATSPLPQAGHGTMAEATVQGMLELLSRLFPAGKQSSPARASDGSRFVALNLDRGHGVGMVRLSVVSLARPVLSACPAGDTCRTLPDGSFVEIGELPDNCIEHQTVFLQRPDAIGVFIQLSSCLSWNGTANPASPVVLSVDEAVRIADDPRWGTTMPQALVDAGRTHFPRLSTFS